MFLVFSNDQTKSSNAPQDSPLKIREVMAHDVVGCGLKTNRFGLTGASSPHSELHYGTGTENIAPWKYEAEAYDAHQAQNLPHA